MGAAPCSRTMDGERRADAPCSAVATIYVCFVENPEAGARTQPESYAEMLGAWTKFHPALDYAT